MDELIKEVEELLQKDVNMYYRDYLTMYKRLTGRGISGCKCNKGKVLTEIINWLKTNKK